MLEKESQLDRIERMLKWFMVREMLENGKNFHWQSCHPLQEEQKELIKFLPDIGDILDDVESGT